MTPSTLRIGSGERRGGEGKKVWRDDSVDKSTCRSWAWWRPPLIAVLRGRGRRSSVSSKPASSKHKKKKTKEHLLLLPETWAPFLHPCWVASRSPGSVPALRAPTNAAFAHTDILIQIGKIVIK